MRPQTLVNTGEVGERRVELASIFKTILWLRIWLSNVLHTWMNLIYSSKDDLCVLSYDTILNGVA